MNNSVLIILSFCFMLLLQGCQKDKITEGDLLVTEGYIDIRITGRSAEGALLNESDRYQTYPLGYENICSAVTANEDVLTFYIRRYNNVTESEYVTLSFTYNSGNTAEPNIEFYYKGKTDNGSTLVFSGNTISQEIVVDNYDASTGTLSGNFSAEVRNFSANQIERVALVEGEFFVKVFEIVY